MAAKKKEAKLKAQIEFRKTLQREALERELAAQAYHRGKLEKNWRETVVRIKEPTLRQDIQVMWHTFERAYDKKDHVITYIMKLMDVADDQFQRTFSTYCDTVDTMINSFMRDTQELSQQNDRKTASILKQDDDYVDIVMRQVKEAETHLELLLYWGHKEADSLAWTIRGENMVKEDEYRTTYFDVREDLRSFLEDKYNATWNDYKAVLKAYVVGTAENQKQARILRQKDNLMADIIAAQAKKIANNDKVLKRLRTELGTYESGSKQAVFRDRRNRHRDACHRLKNNLYGGVNTDVKQLNILIKSSDDAVESLEAKKKKIEKILRLAALCRKFETQREKVLPYGVAPPHSPIQVKNSGRKQISTVDNLIVNELMRTGGLSGLWQRISKAELTKRALLREKMKLEHENAVIISKIRESSEETVTADSFKCICGDKSKKISVVHPCAIEGSLEINKIKMLYKQLQ